MVLQHSTWLFQMKMLKIQDHPAMFPFLNFSQKAMVENSGTFLQRYHKTFHIDIFHSRKSFHGYPAGMAQLIDSPNAFHIQPMQIDTKNRHYNGTDFKADILPKASQAPPNASYSGLLECPCTTRIKKEFNITYAVQNQGSCNTMVERPTECFQAATKLDPAMTKAKMQILDSANYPSGMYIFDISKIVNLMLRNQFCRLFHDSFQKWIFQCYLEQASFWKCLWSRRKSLAWKHLF